MGIREGTYKAFCIVPANNIQLIIVLFIVSFTPSTAVNHTTHPFRITEATQQGQFSKPSTPMVGGGGVRKDKKTLRNAISKYAGHCTFCNTYKRRGVPCFQICTARGFIRNRLLESRHSHGVW